jgi:hypothetical protein
MSRASTHSIVLFNGADAPLLLEFSHTCDVTPKRYCFQVPCLQLAEQKQITKTGNSLLINNLKIPGIFMRDSVISHSVMRMQGVVNDTFQP